MKKGMVLWFNTSLGYGFLRGENNAEIFFHWTSIVSDESYKIVYDGSPVEYELDEDGRAKTVIAQARVSNRNKQLLLVSFTVINNDITIRNFNFDIVRKADAGIKYLRYTEGMALGTSEQISKDEANYIRDVIINNFVQNPSPINSGRKVIYIDDLPYDLMFV
jgi:CspA family cold shock protein